MGESFIYEWITDQGHNLPRQSHKQPVSAPLSPYKCYTAIYTGVAYGQLSVFSQIYSPQSDIQSSDLKTITSLR